VRQRHILKYITVFVGAAAMASQALAADGPGGEMTLGYRMIAPAGFRTYCQQTPTDCLSSVPLLPGPQEEAPLRHGQPTGLWQTAFAQVHAQRSYPTSAIPSSAGARSFDWRLQPRRDAAPTRPPLADPALGSSTPPEPAPGSAAPEKTRLVALDRASQRMLQRVNQTVNAQIRPATDESLYDGRDVWGARAGSDGRLYGDCEDYVLAKRTALIARGVPAAALSIAVARIRRGQTHAVLVVSTDKGDYVMDNLSYWVLPWADVPYDWVMRQNRGDASDWRAILGTTTTVSMTRRIRYR